MTIILKAPKLKGYGKEADISTGGVFYQQGYFV